MKLIILGLSRSSTQEDLFHLLKFYGEVKSCDLVMDNKKNISKGFAFAEMPNDEQAQAAINGLHGKKIRGHKIRIKKSDQNIEKTSGSEETTSS
jgi:RNA recognition motif-containing protein